MTFSYCMLNFINAQACNIMPCLYHKLIQWSMLQFPINDSSRGITCLRDHSKKMMKVQENDCESDNH